MSVRAGLAACLVAFPVLFAAGCLRRVVHRRATASVRRRFPPVPARGDRRGVSSAFEGAATVPAWFERRINTLGLDVEPSALWHRWLLALPVAALIGMVLGGPAVSSLLISAAATLPFVVPLALRGRRTRRIDRQLPAMLDAVGSALRAGGSLHQAVLEAAATAPEPLGREIHTLVRATQAGASMRAELDAWAERSGSTAVRMAVAALVLGLRDGGPQAHAVDGVAATMRDRLALTGEIRALSSQARASAVVIVVAPIIFGTVSAFVDPAVLEFLVASPGGVACLASGVVLDGLGAAWMAAIMRGSE